MDRETDTMDWLPNAETAPLEAALAYRAHGLMKADFPPFVKLV